MYHEQVIEDRAYDSSLAQGASNAVNVCLRVEAGEAVTLIADREAGEIAASLADYINQAGASLRFFVLEDLAERPLNHMPELILQAVRADFARIDDLSCRLIDKARSARSIRGVTPGGTSIRAAFSRRLNWVKTSGIIGPEKWGNLPGGEIFTSPARVDGVFVVDGVVGDYMCSKYGDLRSTPLTIRIEDSRIVDLDCDNLVLLEEFRNYTSTDENSDRVGEFAIGTNLWVQDVIGNILQDEKIPGVHVAFGHPYSEHTGQTWVSSTHIDCVGRQFDIWIDDDQIMTQGQFVL